MKILIIPVSIATLYLLLITGYCNFEGYSIQNYVEEAERQRGEELEGIRKRSLEQIKELEKLKSEGYSEENWVKLQEYKKELEEWKKDDHKKLKKYIKEHSERLLRRVE